MTGGHVREEHPLPAVLMHHAHLVFMAMLVASGFFIHRPWAGWTMATMRQVHFLAAYGLLITLALRIYWAAFGRGSSARGSRTLRRDGRFFLPEASNRGKLLGVAAYYLFLRSERPETAKFNPLQKLTYVGWVVLVIAQAVTGFALYGPTRDILAVLTYALGGPAQVRVYHYLVMWAFIATTAVHVYLAFVEDRGALKLMFGPGDARKEAG